MLEAASCPGVFEASPHDIYLQPHSDDICFSLGAFAHTRRRGILLTIFSKTGYMPNPEGACYPFGALQFYPPSSDWITRSRLNEDRAFAGACNLGFRFLDLPGASLLGHEPFDLSWIAANERRTASPLLTELLSLTAARPSRRRTWLFCPAGIGGHVDHVATRRLAMRNYNLISQFYRIAFYEDLHYASDASVRRYGIDILQSAMRHREFHRCTFAIPEGGMQKMSLVRIYNSQFRSYQPSIREFTPAAEVPASPHEAIWTDELAVARKRSSERKAAEPNACPNGGPRTVGAQL